MKLILISGSGMGAGKTTLARKLGSHVYSLADEIRFSLADKYPEVNFFDKSQEAKRRVVEGTGGLTMRDLLINEGQARRAEDPLHWVASLARHIDFEQEGGNTVCIDDIRFLNEKSYLVDYFSQTATITHFHVVSKNSVSELVYENTELADCCDYFLQRD